MTEVQKEILIAKMLDSPSCLSDEEVDIILHDDEMRDIYEISCAVSGCVRSTEPVLDMDEEWSRFNLRRRRKRSTMRWITSVAAMLSGIILVSFLTGIFSDRIPSSDDTAAMDDTYPHKTVEVALFALEETYHPRIPEEEEIPAPPERSTPAKIRKSQPHRPLATPETKISDMEIDEYLRIQQAAIDNEIALQSAQVIKDEYQLLTDPEAIGGFDIDVDNAIKRITVQ